MKDYIERASVHSIIEQTSTFAFTRGGMHEKVDSLPAADVAEVRHGRWIHPVPGDGENHCSVCHAEQPWFYGYGYYEPDYCPNCGALMREVENGEK